VDNGLVIAGSAATVRETLRDPWSDDKDYWYPKLLNQIAKPGAAISQTSYGVGAKSKKPRHTL
jgi:hypothetical protein